MTPFAKPVLVPAFPIRLNPPDVKAPEISLKLPFAAMILLLTVHMPVSNERVPLIPPFSLLLIVLLETFSVILEILIPGPPLFPLIVLLVTCNLLVVPVANSVSIPPKVLPVIVLSVIVVVMEPLPALLATP